jgi:hypothetical protein
MRSAFPRIKQVRASVLRGGGADYFDQPSGHWIDEQWTSPMLKYPEFQKRRSFGVDVLGTLVVEIYYILGGAVRDEISFYATTSRPDLAKPMGFLGGKMPLVYGAADGQEGMDKDLAILADMRSKVGNDFWLMLDGWMSLDVNYATRLVHRAHEFAVNGRLRVSELDKPGFSVELNRDIKLHRPYEH